MRVRWSCTLFSLYGKRHLNGQKHTEELVGEWDLSYHNLRNHLNNR